MMIKRRECIIRQITGEKDRVANWGAKSLIDYRSSNPTNSPGSRDKLHLCIVDFVLR
jgi:hypothetical protein